MKFSAADLSTSIATDWMGFTGFDDVGGAKRFDSVANDDDSANVIDSACIVIVGYGAVVELIVDFGVGLIIVAVVVSFLVLCTISCRSPVFIALSVHGLQYDSLCIT